MKKPDLSNTRSGYVLNLAIEPGGARRDCTFAYGTFEQLCFVLRQEYQPRKREWLDLPLSMAGQSADLVAVDRDRVEVARLDLREFVTLTVGHLRARLDDVDALEAVYAARPGQKLESVSFEIDFKGLDAALPKLESPPLQPGEALSFGKGRQSGYAQYGYESREEWIFPHEREPPPPRRVTSKTGFVQWGSEPNGRFPELGPLQRVPQAKQLTQGRSRRKGFPAAAWFEVLDNHSKRPLSDCPIAPDHHVVSKPVRDALKPWLDGVMVRGN